MNTVNTWLHSAETERYWGNLNFTLACTVFYDLWPLCLCFVRLVGRIWRRRKARLRTQCWRCLRWRRSLMPFIRYHTHGSFGKIIKKRTLLLHMSTLFKYIQKYLSPSCCVFTFCSTAFIWQSQVIVTFGIGEKWRQTISFPFKSCLDPSYPSLRGSQSLGWTTVSSVTKK